MAAGKEIVNPSEEIVFTSECEPGTVTYMVYPDTQGAKQLRALGETLGEGEKAD